MTRTPQLACPGARGRSRALPLAFAGALAAGAGFSLARGTLPPTAGSACVAACVATLGAAAIALFALAHRGHGRLASAVAWLLLPATFAASGATSRRLAEAQLLPVHAGGRGWIVGRIDGLPESGATGPRFVLAVERSSLGLPVRARLACSARAAHPPPDGTRVRALVDLDGPGPATNPGGFDARAWSRIAGVAGRARIVPGTLAVVAAPAALDLRARLVSPPRGRLLAAIARQERGRASAFLAGFLLGDRSRLDAGANDDLRRAGALHLLAISGMHVALALVLAGRAVALLGLRGRRAACARLAVAIGYSALAGGSASVWRAGATACAVELGALSGRRVAGEQGLGLAVLALVALRPACTLDAGFQLSVLATWGLLGLAQPLQRTLLARVDGAWAGPAKGLRVARALVHKTAGALVPTLGAQLVALPCMASSFGAVSALGLLSNLVLVPVTDLALVSGLIALAAEALWSPAAQPFWTVADAAALATLRGANWLARAPAALRPLGNAPWAIVAVGLGLGALLLVRAGCGRTGGRARRIALAGAGVVGIAGAVAIVTPRPAARGPAFVWTLFDVGQGDGMLLRFPDGRALVIDGGMADEAFDQGARVVVPALRARHVYALDAVLATHRDLDHLGGLPAVVRDVPCSWVAGPGDVPGRILGPTRKRGGAAGRARAFEVMRGQRLLAGDDYRVTCLWPPRGFRRDARWTPNRESVVLLVELLAADTLRILLMGDADTLVEHELARTALPACALLKVGHHGSRTSSGEAFLDQVRPRVALVSVGRVNRFGHPHPDVRARYARRGIAWRSTGEEGALDVVARTGVDGRWRVSIAPARGARPIALATRAWGGVTCVIHDVAPLASTRSPRFRSRHQPARPRRRRSRRRAGRVDRARDERPAGMRRGRDRARARNRGRASGAGTVPHAVRRRRRSPLGRAPPRARRRHGPAGRLHAHPARAVARGLSGSGAQPSSVAAACVSGDRCDRSGVQARCAYHRMHRPPGHPRHRRGPDPHAERRTRARRR